MGARGEAIAILTKVLNSRVEEVSIAIHEAERELSILVTLRSSLMVGTDPAIILGIMEAKGILRNVTGNAGIVQEPKGCPTPGACSCVR